MFINLPRTPEKAISVKSDSISSSNPAPMLIEVLKAWGFNIKKMCSGSSPVKVRMVVLPRCGWKIEMGIER